MTDHTVLLFEVYDVGQARVQTHQVRPKLCALNSRSVFVCLVLRNRRVSVMGEDTQRDALTNVTDDGNNGNASTDDEQKKDTVYFFVGGCSESHNQEAAGEVTMALIDYFYLPNELRNNVQVVQEIETAPGGLHEQRWHVFKACLAPSLDAWVDKRGEGTTYHSLYYSSLAVDGDDCQLPEGAGVNAHSLDGNSHGIDTRSHTYGESEPAVGLRESPDESKGQTKDEAVEEEDEEDDEEEERSSSVIYEEVGAFVNEQLVRTNLSNDLEISEGDVIRGQREIMKRLQFPCC